jgi:soluble lytic murein transglycosylase
VRIRLALSLVILLGCCGAFAPAQSVSTAKKKKPAATSKKKAKKPPTTQRTTQLQRTFSESADLKPMAAQLLDTHLPAAYRGVEAYARKHDETAAGSLAWLVLGEAYLTDTQPQKAILALQHAQKHAGELGDYADYLLAQALQQTGEQTEVAGLLKTFATSYPKSLLVTDAAVLQANALIATGSPAQAAAILEQHRTPLRPDVELVLGRAYQKTGNNAKASESYRLIYYTLPLSSQADEAEAQLQLMSGISLPTAPYAQRRRRAELLYQGKQYGDAANEYGSLMDHAPSGDLRLLQVAYGTALYRAKRYKDARMVLQGVEEAPDEINAQRLFYLSEMAKDDSKQWLDLINHMRDIVSGSQWLSEALLAQGNRALIKKDYPSALAFFQETWSRNPQGKYASYTHWKTAWLSYRLGKRQDAKRLFEEQITNYPGGLEVSSALYWRARLAEDDKDLPRAKAYYAKLAERYKLFYYGALGADRLHRLGYEGAAAPDAVLAKVPPVDLPIFSTVAPTENVRVQKAMVLANGALYDFAIRELEAAGSDPTTTIWAQGEIAKFYVEQGREYRALQLLKRAIPGYYSYDIAQMPRALWQILFPKPYWTDLTKHSLDNNLDPYLVAALIRQESEFNPSAVSRAKAMGLMQLLPSVGKRMAHQLKIKGYNTAQLTVPSVNLQLGSSYFKQVLDQYNGQLEYALAAYNAGGDRVDQWRQENDHDIVEFVESIPFTETREYVQAIERNAVIYRKLYGPQ